MYLLKIQGKLEHLSGSSQYDIVNSVLQYVRQAILKARVEDAQLGVESYQRTLNFTEPHTQPTGMHKQKLLTFNRKPFGVLYNMRDNREKRFMDYIEVQKFGDQTLKYVGIQLTEKLEEYGKGHNVGWNHHAEREAMKFISQIGSK